MSCNPAATTTIPITVNAIPMSCLRCYNASFLSPPPPNACKGCMHERPLLSVGCVPFKDGLHLGNLFLLGLHDRIAQLDDFRVSDG